MLARQRRHPTNRWTGATGRDFRIKRDPAKLLGNAVARSTQPFGCLLEMTMLRTFLSILFVLLISAESYAQQDGFWGTARQRHLKGPVRLVTTRCPDPKTTRITITKLEFARNGNLVAITAPQAFFGDITFPISRKVTKRNAKGDGEEATLSLEGDVLERYRAEYVYDDIGNWTKAVRYRMLTYTWEGGPPENTWQIMDTCTRDIEYYR
jgi:hypothetical protein